MALWTDTSAISLKRVAALGVAIALAACSSRPVESPQLRTELPKEAVALVPGDGAIKPAAGAGVATASTAARPAGPVQRQDVIAFSGGGADGAFGAGLLVGWAETGKRPNFDIVTGVSTGSFMAALLFAGPKYDGKLRDLYTNVSSADIFVDKGAAGLASESLYDDTPLRKQIEKIVTKSFLADVAAQHNTGRRLFVATTNLDAGELVVWDMGQIAIGNRADPLLQFQKVLRASAAVPAFFPPVYIKPQKGVELRQAHVDGGVKAPVLVRGFMFEQPAKQRNLYVVINGPLSRFNSAKAVEANVKDIGRKAITELLRTTLDQALFQGYVLARNSGTEYNLVAIPDNVVPSNDALDFNKAKMKELYRVGYEFGRSGKPWLKEPPRLSSFERVAAPAKPTTPATPAAIAAVPAAAVKDVSGAIKTTVTDLQSMVMNGP